MNKDNIRLYINSTPHIEEYEKWDELIDIWKQLGTLFNKYKDTFQFKNYDKVFNYEMTIETSFIIDDLIRDKAEYDELNAIQDNDFEKRSKIRNRYKRENEPFLYIDIIYNEEDGFLNHYIEEFFEDLFLAMNIAFPGSLDLYNTYYKLSGRDENIKIFSYSSFFFEGCWSTFREWNWPNIKIIEIEKVWKWIKDIGLVNKVIGKTPIQRSLISILNQSGVEEIQSQFLLTAQALESLLVEENESVSKLLRERITSIIGWPDKDTKWLQKFYNIRSRIIHGDSEIMRITFNDIIDFECDEYYHKYLQTLKKVTAVYIALIQELVINSSKGFKFSQQYEHVYI